MTHLSGAALGTVQRHKERKINGGCYGAGGIPMAIFSVILSLGNIHSKPHILQSRQWGLRGVRPFPGSHRLLGQEGPSGLAPWCFPVSTPGLIIKTKPL